MPSHTVIRQGFAFIVMTMFSLAGIGVHAATLKSGIDDARVTYVARDSVYLSCGRECGVAVGDAFRLMRNGEMVARIRIIQVNDTSASAAVTVRKGRIQAGDLVVPGETENARTSSPGGGVVSSATSHQNPQWDEDGLQDVWTRALIESPPVRVAHRNTGTAPDRLATLSAGAGTALHQYAYIQSRNYLRTEQTLWFFARGGQASEPGISWAVDGTLRGRYDDGNDRYLEDQRFIPLIRRLSVSYHFRQHPITLTLGRFSPDAPIVHTIDGLETGLEARRFSLSLFGGILPDEQDMAPTVTRQAVGIATAITPLAAGNYTAEAAVLAKLHKGELYRAALGLNNWFYTASGVHFSQTAVVDFLSASKDAQSRADITLSRATVDAAWPLTARMQMDVRGRYDKSILFSRDYSDLPREWLTYVDRTGEARLETGLPMRTRRYREVRPFVFGRADLVSGGVDGGRGGAGVSIRDDSVFSSQTGLTTVIDYSGGTGQTLNIDLTTNTPLKNGALQLLGGLYTTWNWVYQSDVHTLRNLAFVMLQGQLRPNIDLFANLQTGYDHALVRLTYPFGVWMQVHVGITARY